MGRPAANLIGHRFGRLTVLSRLVTSYKKNALWECRCNCGNIHVVSSAHLGFTKSCGCLKREIATSRIYQQLTRHGRSGTSEHTAWIQMRQRCSLPNHRAWKDYGGRGVTVCERWLNSFENFFADMGMKPSPKHSIDRVNNDGNYEPNNCRWATKSEQRRNQRPRMVQHAEA